MLDGSKGASNELLDFSVDKVPDTGLDRISFSGWKASVGEVEPEILTLLAAKATQLETLYINYMGSCTEQMKHALTDMVQSIVRLDPPMTRLDL